MTKAAYVISHGMPCGHCFDLRFLALALQMAKAARMGLRDLHNLFVQQWHSKRCARAFRRWHFLHIRNCFFFMFHL